MKILLAAEGDSIVEDAKTCLLKACPNAHVTRTKSLEKTLESLSGEYDAVVLDLGSIGSRGLDAVTAVRDRAPRAAVVALAGDENLEDGLEVVRLGADDYVVRTRMDQGRLARAVRYAVERKAMEDNLRESERLHRVVLSSMSEAVFIVDAEGAFTYVCPNVEMTLGYSQEEFLALGNIRALMGVTVLERAGLSDGVEMHNVEWKTTAKSGAVRHFLVSAKPVDIGGGRYLFTCRDVTDRKKAEADLRESEERLRSALDVSEMGTWDYYYETDEIVWSEQMSTLFDLPLDAFDGKRSTARSCIHPDDVGAVSAEFDRVAAEGGIYAVDYRVPQSDGSELWLSSRGRVYTDDRGRPQRLIGVVADVTSRKNDERRRQLIHDALERRVRERTAELEASNRELEAFTYSISHDLRAPLRSIEGFSKILLDRFGSKFSDEAMHYVDRVRQNTLQMNRLVDDLLRFSRLNSQVLRKTTVHPEEVIGGVMSDLDTADLTRTVIVEIGDLPACEADPNLLKQVYANLLDNALKFTRDRYGARIWVDAETNGDRTVYRVADNGVGFDMQYVDKLFGVFQRLHRAEEFEGTGVGLAIVQRIVHHHGGEIWAESAPGNGAAFYFTLS